MNLFRHPLKTVAQRFPLVLSSSKHQRIFSQLERAMRIEALFRLWRLAEKLQTQAER
jgi:hypothetical protein